MPVLQEDLTDEEWEALSDERDEALAKLAVSASTTDGTVGKQEDDQ